MRTRRLGEQQVTALGSGDLSLPRSAARGVAARDVEHALHEALDLGITLFDVAADADSERLVGDAIRVHRARDRAVVAARVPALGPRGEGPPGAPRDGLIHVLPPAYVQRRVEDALRATRLDALPVAVLAVRPAWRTSRAWPELVGTCARLVREGKVRDWGAWIDEPQDEAAAELAREPWLAALWVPYSLCDRRADALIAQVAEAAAALAALEAREAREAAALAQAQASGAAEPAAPRPSDRRRGRPGEGSRGDVSDVRDASDDRRDDPGAANRGPGDGASALAALELLGDPRAVLSAPAALLDAVLAAPAPAPAAATPTNVLAPPPRPHVPAILARAPLAGAALAGTLGPGAKLRPRDDRAELPAAVLDRIAVGVARLAHLVKRPPPAALATEAARAIAERTPRRDEVACEDLAELALRFAIDRAGIALPRLHRRAHLLPGLVAAAAGPLPDPTCAALAELVAADS